MGKVPDPAGDIDSNTALVRALTCTCTAINYISHMLSVSATCALRKIFDFLMSLKFK